MKVVGWRFCQSIERRETGLSVRSKLDAFWSIFRSAKMSMISSAKPLTVWGVDEQVMMVFFMDSFHRKFGGLHWWREVGMLFVIFSRHTQFWLGHLGDTI